MHLLPDPGPPDPTSTAILEALGTRPKELFGRSKNESSVLAWYGFRGENGS